MTLSYADELRRREPLEYEKARLIIDVATELKLALEDSGLTQRDLAARLGRTPGMVSRQLSGHENLSLGKIAELALALGKRFEIKLENAQRARARTHGPVRVVWSQPTGASQTGRFRVAVPSTTDEKGAEHATAA